MNIFKRLENYWLELLIGIGILYFLDFRFFLFYLLVILILMDERLRFYLSGIIQNQNENRLRLRTILRKSKLDINDVNKVIEEAEEELNADSVESFIETFKKDVNY